MHMEFDGDNESDAPIRSLSQLYAITGFTSWRFIPSLVLNVGSSGAEVLAFACLVPAIQILTGSPLDYPPYLEKILQFAAGGELNDSTQLAFILFGLVFFLGILKNAMRLVSTLLLSWQSLQFANALRKALFERLITFGPLYFQVNGRNAPISSINMFAGELSNRITAIVNGFAGILSILTFIGFLFYLSPALMILALISLPGLIFFQSLLFKKLRKSSRTNFIMRDKLVRYTRNFFDNFEFVVASNAEKQEKERFFGLSDLTAQHSYSVNKKQLILPFLNEVFFIIILVGILLSIWIVSQNWESKSLENYGVFIIALRRSTHYVNKVSTLKMTTILIDTTIGHINKVLFPERDFALENGTLPTPETVDSISFDSVFFSYPNSPRTVLTDMSFSIPGNKMTAIVGKTGAGKSTVLQMMLRFMDPQDGSININNTPLTELDYNCWRRSVAYVSQETYLFDASLYDNCVFGITPLPSKEDVLEALKLSHLIDIVEPTPEGLDMEIGEKGIRLSGGERQRLSICRAILRNAPIIFLDEATSALDSDTEKLVHAAIVNLSKGRTLVVIAHRLSTIQNADKVILIEEGQVKESGSINELLSQQGTFYKFWQQNNIEPSDSLFHV